MPIGDYDISSTVNSLTQPNTAGSYYVDSVNGANLTGTISVATSTWPWYPTYWCSHTDNRMQQAFKIVKHLMDKKLVKLNTIPQFVSLVDELMTIL